MGLFTQSRHIAPRRAAAFRADSTAVTELDRILKANESYTASPMAGPPAKRLCIVTCMDARIDPLAAFGLDLGDTHVIRNAGGRVTDDTIRSVVLSAHALGTREFGVIHHTRCGVQTTNDAIKEALAGLDVGHIDFLAFDDLDQSVRDDVQALVDTKLLPPDAAVWGGVYDVDTGQLRIVVEP